MQVREPLSPMLFPALPLSSNNANVDVRKVCGCDSCRSLEVALEAHAIAIRRGTADETRRAVQICAQRVDERHKLGDSIDRPIWWTAKRLSRSNANAATIAARRADVASLREAGLSETRIGKWLGVPSSIIHGDLKVLRIRPAFTVDSRGRKRRAKGSTVT